MSLDVYLYAPGEKPTTDEYSLPLYESNITHNLGKMAKEASLYVALWYPDEPGWTHARDLIGPLERSTVYAQFIVSGLLRGDQQTRYASYAIGRQWGWLSVNDIRRMEEMNDIPEGDV